MVNHNTRLGSRGEALALQVLQDQGYLLLSKNWRGQAGELDLVMAEQQELVFVEVKTRSSMNFGDPLEAVTPEKLQRLHRLAQEWQHEHDFWLPYRIDVLGIVLCRDGSVNIEHLNMVTP